jgi:hypothetical protein
MTLDPGELQLTSDIGDVIRLAVAPVFLLTGVGTMLTVLTNRLARAVDRARALEREAVAGAEADRVLELHRSLATLAQRGRLLSVAIALCTICALLVSLVIMVLFLGAALKIGVGLLIGALFVGAMLSFTGAILCFLREVFIATRTLRSGLHRLR